MTNLRTSAATVRLTVASTTRRVDLALPGALPVVELVPELARAVGLFDGHSEYGGHRLVTPAGRVLDPAAGLCAQGIEDGGLLTIVAGADDEPPPLYDDPAEAVGDALTSQWSWGKAGWARVGTVGATTLLGLGAVATAVLRGPGSPGPVPGAVVAAGLVVAAVLLSRVAGRHRLAVLAGWVSAAYAAAAVLSQSPDQSVSGAAVGAAGLAAAVVASACLLGVAQERALCFPPVLGGTVVGGAWLVGRAVGADPRVLVVTALVLLVLASSAAPGLALALAGAGTDDGWAGPVDVVRVEQDARLAHQLLVAVSAGVGFVLVVAAPLAVALGAAGVALAGCCCLVALVRSRRHRSGAEVLAALATGAAALGLVVVTTLGLYPSARAAVVLACVTVGVGVLLVPTLPTGAGVRLCRLVDVFEAVAVLALLPLLVVASGALDAVLGRGGA